MPDNEEVIYLLAVLGLSSAAMRRSVREALQIDELEVYELLKAIDERIGKDKIELVSKCYYDYVFKSL